MQIVIIGNPYRASFFVKVIDEWNDDIPSFRNGVFLLCIDGELFPKSINTSTLNVDIPDVMDRLCGIPLNEKIFNMGKEDAYIEMYNMTFPKEGGCDYGCRFYISPPGLYDYNCYAFAVRSKSQVRFMAARLKYVVDESASDLSNAVISDAIITHDELNEIIFELSKIINPVAE